MRSPRRQRLPPRAHPSPQRPRRPRSDTQPAGATDVVTVANHDLFWMRRALAEAERGRGAVEPNPMVGAVVVRDGRLAGFGHHERFGGPHAEVLALARAGDLARGATLYVTLAPCCPTGKTHPCT